MRYIKISLFSEDMMMPEKVDILLVDDDDELREMLAEQLAEASYSIRSANSVPTAQHLLLDNSFKLVITDLKMPGQTGLDLLHFVKKKVNIPVIIFSGFLAKFDKTEFKKAGAYEVLEKPFSIHTLLEIIGRLLKCGGFETNFNEKDVSEEYCKIPLDEILLGNKSFYSIYIEVGAGNFKKIFNKGDSIDINRINNYKKRNVEFLFLRKDEFREYVSLNINLTKKVSQVNKISHAKKMAFLANTVKLFIKDIYLSNVDEESLSSSKLVVESVADVLLNTADTEELLFLLHDSNEQLYSHSMAVSLVAVLIAKALGWSSPSILYKIALAGMLHDIGQKEIEEEINTVLRKDWTASIRKKYESHCIRGMDILSSIPSLHSDYATVALQHHEMYHGGGYPAGLKGKRIHPLARLIGIADKFSFLVFDSIYGPSKTSQEAIKQMVDMEYFAYDPQMLKAFIRQFKL